MVELLMGSVKEVGLEALVEPDTPLLEVHVTVLVDWILDAEEIRDVKLLAEDVVVSVSSSFFATDPFIPVGE